MSRAALAATVNLRLAVTIGDGRKGFTTIWADGLNSRILRMG
jgi:hypothetical protein